MGDRMRAVEGVAVRLPRPLRALLRTPYWWAYRQISCSWFCRRQPRLVPLSHILQQRTLVGQQVDALLPPQSKTRATGRKLCNRTLSGFLADDELGTWALDAASLNFLEREIATRRPHAILEFGAGVSTLCFARFMLELYGKTDAPRVFSIEQNQWQVESTRQRLAQMSLQDMVSILQAPLVKQRIEELETECYDLSPTGLEKFLGRTRPDFVVIDGPAGDADVRFGTLPLVKDHLRHEAMFFLHDALRDEELDIARRWSTLPYTAIAGLYQLGKGLLAGTINTKA